MRLRLSVVFCTTRVVLLITWRIAAFSNNVATAACSLHAKVYIPTVVNSSKVLQLPTNLKEIQSEAFRGDDGFGKVIIPDGATTIGFWAFENCPHLSLILIPDTVTSIHEYAFANSDNVVFQCSSDSYAAEYAHEHEIPYITAQ